jgi:hypothetical protein
VADDHTLSPVASFSSEDKAKYRLLAIQRQCLTGNIVPAIFFHSRFRRI